MALLERPRIFKTKHDGTPVNKTLSNSHPYQINFVLTAVTFCKIKQNKFTPQLFLFENVIGPVRFSAP